MVNSIIGMLFFLLCLFLFNMPDSVVALPLILRFGDRVRFIAALILLIAYLLLKKDVLKDGLFIAALVFTLYVWIITVSNSGQTMTVFSNYIVNGLSSVLLFSLFFDVNAKKYAWIAFIYYLAIVVLNGLTAMHDPFTDPTWYAYQIHGTRYIFVGNVNLTFIYVIITFALGTFVSERYCRYVWIVNFAMLLFSIHTAVITYCETEIIVFALMGFLALAAILAARFRIFEWVPKLLNPFVFSILNIAAAVVFYLIATGKMAIPFGIDLQLHGRERIWLYAVEAFRQKPLFGHGLQVPLAEGMDYPHVHSIFLEIPYLSGIAGSLLFIGMMAVILSALMRVKDKGIRYAFCFLLGLFFTASLMEFYPVQGMLTLFAAVYYGGRTLTGLKE